MVTLGLSRVDGSPKPISARALFLFGLIPSHTLKPIWVGQKVNSIR